MNSQTRDAIEFWFDFSSPYAYFASLSIEALAVQHGRSVAWNPFALGAVFKITGMRSLSETPMRGDYARHDWARLARRHRAPFVLPHGHPLSTVAVARAFLWLQTSKPDRAVPFATEALSRYFGRGIDVATGVEIARVADAVGLNSMELNEAIQRTEWKEAFHRQTNCAVEKGVFGSPFFFIDGEPFWGTDRMEMMDAWLTGGGW
ncbi:MAG: 2-hydroxychromene-2-carboxylate isomerase [Rhizobiaceae bacterium]